MVIDYDNKFYENKLGLDSIAFLTYSTSIYRRIN